MLDDVGKAPPTEDIEYWLNLGTFLNDFATYQHTYNKPTGKDTPESCYYCGENTHVQMNKKFGHYVCSKHNHQLDRYGECFETTPKYIVHDDCVECIIYGDKRKETTITVDAIDLPLLFYSDSVNASENRPKIYDKTNNKHTLLYRAIYNIKDNNIVVDHIDGNPLNNRRKNLRVCTNMQNNRNKKITNKNTSDIIGVCWTPNRNKWRAHIVVNYKQKHLGYYTNIEDAIVARLTAEREYFGEFAPQQHLFTQYEIEPFNTQNNSVDYNKHFKEVLRMYMVASKLGSTARGKAEDNFLNGILVSFDLTCSNKMWIEFERYHFADIVSGQSTMHRIVKLAERNIFNEYVVDETKETLKKLLDKFNKDKSTYNYLCLLYNIPSGIELTDHIVTNYGQLKTMYNQRHNHRLPEWRKFCDYVIQLPFFSELTGITKEKTDE